MTYSTIGKQRRLDRLFRDGRTIVVPVDDSLIFGPKDGLFDLPKTINTILAGQPNALLGFKHDIEYLASMKYNIPFIFNITASTILNSHTKKVLIASVENALSAGADCVAAHVNFSSQYESEMLHNFSFVANECDRLGAPLLAIAYPRSEKNGIDYNYEDIGENDIDAFTELVSHCVRIVSQLGADIVKTYYTGSTESFRSVITAACGKPVVIAGGPEVSVEISLKRAIGAIEAGSSGVSYGRNVFNSDYIVPYLTVMRDIIFDGIALNKALESYNNLVGGTHG